MRSSVSTVREGWEAERLVGGAGRRRKMLERIWGLLIGLGWKRERCLSELYMFVHSLGEAVGGRGQGMTVS